MSLGLRQWYKRKRTSVEMIQFELEKKESVKAVTYALSENFESPNLATARCELYGYIKTLIEFRHSFIMQFEKDDEIYAAGVVLLQHIISNNVKYRRDYLSRGDLLLKFMMLIL